MMMMSQTSLSPDVLEMQIRNMQQIMQNMMKMKADEEAKKERLRKEAEEKERLEK